MKAEPDEMDFVCLNKNVNLDCICVSNPLLCPSHLYFTVSSIPFSSAFLCLLLVVFLSFLFNLIFLCFLAPSSIMTVVNLRLSVPAVLTENANYLTLYRTVFVLYI